MIKENGINTDQFYPAIYFEGEGPGEYYWIMNNKKVEQCLLISSNIQKITKGVRDDKTR